MKVDNTEFLRKIEPYELKKKLEELKKNWHIVDAFVKDGLVTQKQKGFFDFVHTADSLRNGLFGIKTDLTCENCIIELFLWSIAFEKKAKSVIDSQNKKIKKQKK